MKNLISIIIPVFNEERTINKILKKILAQDEFEKEIIVINDGSTDKTKSILEKEFIDKVILISNIRNFGKGYSIRKSSLQ